MKNKKLSRLLQLSAAKNIENLIIMLQLLDTEMSTA